VFINCAAAQLKDLFVKYMYTKKLTRGRVKANVKTSTVQNIDLQKTVVTKFKEHFDESDRDSDDSAAAATTRSRTSRPSRPSQATAATATTAATTTAIAASTALTT
jgi:hypothetical protein